MSKHTLSKIVECNNDCGPNRGACPGHIITLVHNKSVDVVTLTVVSVGSEHPEIEHIFDDRIFREIIRMWSEE